MKSLPLLVKILLGAGCVAALATAAVARHGTPETDATSAPAQMEQTARAIPVVLTPASKRMFETRVVVQGSVEARDSALVPARLATTLTELFVDEGDTVESGVTKLFRSDDVKLRKALEMRKQDLAVAACSRLESEANREQVQAILERAEKDLKRQTRLFKQDGIGTMDAIEQCESVHKQAVARLKHADSLVALAIERERQAEAAVGMAEKDLSDATVLAPLSGVVSQRFQEVGEMGDITKPVLRIDDTSVLEISAFLPARYYARIHAGQTHMSIEVEGAPVGTLPVSYRSPTIDERLRTFEVKCVLAQPPADIAPGAMASVTVVLDRQETLGIPQDAIQSRAGKSVVFTVENDAARMVAVRPGMITDGFVQLLDDALTDTAHVVIQGQFLLNDASPVRVQEAD